MKNSLISISLFVIFIAGLYFLANIQLFYAIGFGVLLLVHELGHVFALNKIKGEIKGVYFLPFLGAVTTGNKRKKSENEHAYFKYLGPFVGTLGVLLTLGIFFFLKDERFLNLVFIGSVLNLINMIPVVPLDGYGILRGSIKNIEWIGFLVLIVLGFFIFHEYILTLFFLTIFVLFSDSQTKGDTGFKVYEAILAGIFILTMIVLTITAKEIWVWNMFLIAFLVYAFWVYIKATLFDIETTQDEKQNQIILVPLVRKEKILWIVRYILLVLVLLALAFYSR